MTTKSEKLEGGRNFCASHLIFENGKPLEQFIVGVSTLSKALLPSAKKIAPC